MLGIDDYLQLLDSKDYKEDVIMTYLLDCDERKLKVVRTIKESFNLPIYDTLPEAEFQIVGPDEIDKCIYPGIKKWIEGFRNARFVVTDSFHGTALSIVFHKPFVSIQNNKRGGSRLESLLNMFGLRSRLIEQYNESEVREISHEEINWIEVDATLGLWREKSMSFLNNALQN